MNLALAHTLAGFFGPLASTFDIFAGKLPNKGTEFSILNAATIGAGGIGWFLAVYVGPLVSLLRSPLPTDLPVDSLYTASLLLNGIIKNPKILPIIKINS